MKRYALLLLAIGALASVASSQVPILPVRPAGSFHPGVVTTPGGGLCTGTFQFDGGNGAGAVLLDYTCATSAGLGQSGAGGTFVPPAGTGCAVVNGNDPMWVFPCITVAATDSNGNVCFCKTTVFVAKNPGSHLNANILSRAWGACVGAVDPTYGSAVWPAAVQVGYELLTVNTSSQSLGSEAPCFPITLRGIDVGAGVPIANELAIYAGCCAYSFIPQQLAADLNLTPVETVDLSVFHPDTVKGLDIQGLRGNGQTLFDVVALPEIDFGDGPRSGLALVIDDANSSKVILGGGDTDLLAGFSHIPGRGAGGEDALVMGSVSSPIAPLHAFQPTPAVVKSNGGVVIAPALPSQGWVEGVTLLSFDTTSGPFGFGPALGLFPDALTALPFSLPASAGSPLHFIPSPGQFPEVPLTLPAGTFVAGFTADIAMAYLTPAGQLEVTGPTRLSHPHP